MRRILLAVLTIIIIQGASAQIEHGGEPLSWQLKTASDLSFYRTDAINLQRALQEDAVTDQYKETIYRFGIDHEVDLDFFSMADQEVMDDGRTIYRLGIECPEAVTVNFLVDDFFLPQGAKLYVYGPETHEKKGAFTAENNRESRVFPIGLIGGSRVVIEYLGPRNGTESIHISQITHGYRGILGYLDANKGPFGNSGACNINVNCPEGLPYSDLKRSVGIIVQGGGLCSGSLVNNVEQDETPLFLSANHCLGNPVNWLYYFNHESSSCSGNSGPSNQSMSGGQLLSNSSNSDFALIELNSNLPASYAPCFGGFDATDVQSATSGIGIHHPGGDIKKICFEENPPFHQTINFNGNPSTSMWMINEWELGVTEGGSSGSPLFNQFGHIIGVLSGGAAACDGTVNNGLYDFYGRLGVSWNGTMASNRLKDYLDPMNSGIDMMDTYCPYEVPSSIYEEFEDEGAFSIYPNPASDLLKLNLNNGIGAYTIKVINAIGEVVFEQSNAGEVQVTMDLSELINGFYMVQVSNGAMSSTRPFIKK